MAEVTIRPVQSSPDVRRFIKFQWVPYKGNPVWVPPLLMDRRKLIDRKKNPFYKHAEAEFFLAERDGEVVGRIGAILNHNHNTQHNENIGFFGFFECIEDQAVAFALFDAAKNWLAAKGVDAIRGAKDLYSWYLHGEKVFSEKFVRVSEAARQRQGLVFRSLNVKDFANEVQKIHEMYTRGWTANWGEVPLTDDEFNYMAADLKAIVNRWDSGCHCLITINS